MLIIRQLQGGILRSPFSILHFSLFNTVSPVLRVQVFWVTQCSNIIGNPEKCSGLPIFRELMLVNHNISPFHPLLLEVVETLLGLGLEGKVFRRIGLEWPVGKGFADGTPLLHVLPCGYGRCRGER